MASTSRGGGGDADILLDDEIEDVLFDVDDSDIDPDFELSEDESLPIERSDDESDDQELPQVLPTIRRQGVGTQRGRPMIDQLPVIDNDWEDWSEGRPRPDFELIPFDENQSGFVPPINEPRPTSPLDFFHLFFSLALFREIVEETNRYAKEKIAKATPLPKHSIWWQWTDVTLKEMIAFHGVLLNMGRQIKKSMKDFFSNDWLDSSDFCKNIFSRKRFCQIFWALHVSPPYNYARPTTPNRNMHSRASKVKNIVDYVGTKFLEVYKPTKYLSADESTVSFKGRVVFKMYNPQKPTKWGLRLYVLADSTNGYVSVIIPYYGSFTTNSLIRPDLPFTARIILQLATSLTNATQQSGYFLYTDRFYSSVQLADELRAIGFHFTGTIMLNRVGLPKKMKKKTLKHLPTHNVVAFRNKHSDILALAWKDKRVVSMISTCHNANTQEIRRTGKNNIVEVVNKPVVICDYTAKMGGVDRSDHYCTSYSFARKSLKWWRKLYFWILEVSVVNSFILYNMERSRNNLRPVSHMAYRKELIKMLVSDVRNLHPKRGRPTSLDSESSVRMNGLYHSIKVSEGKKTKDCAVCSNRKIPGGRKETSFYCDTCPRKPGLHPNGCFDRYHTKKDYKI